MTTPAASMRSLTSGTGDQGAPVWRVWSRRVGSQGRKRTPTAPNASALSMTRRRRSARSNAIGTSASAAPATRYRPQLCVYSSRVVLATKPGSMRRRPKAKACRNVATISRASSATSEYERASTLNAVSRGFVAVNTAQIHPALRPKRLQPAQRATGIIASANTSESACRASSLRPNTAIHPLSSR